MLIHLAASIFCIHKAPPPAPRPPACPLPRLCVPLPVPHPAEVLLIIHNRDSSHPVPLDRCRAIIR
jgi:hypothetical protein